MKELDLTKLIPLSEREAEVVAGGVLVVRGGCPGCTSGGYFNSALAQVINPAETVSAGGVLAE